ncbi:MAG: TolC family protein [Verrucomicrobiales bacterium]|nr:TolC family protein [Verrucomicrobiales bacterium]
MIISIMPIAALLILALWFSPSFVYAEQQETPTRKGDSRGGAMHSRLYVNESLHYPFPLPLVDQKTETPLKKARKPLLFNQLMQAVEADFPLILAALEAGEIASGEMLAAKGGFDLKLNTSAGVNALGYYQNEMAGVKLEQPLEKFGASLFGGYKLGSGNFAVWDGGLRTNSGGEISSGIKLPLLSGRVIDKRRLALWQARISQDRAQPIVLQKKLEVSKKAASAYWKWVAAGKKIEIAKRLLFLAENRHATLESSHKEGEVPRLAITENSRLIVERQSILISSSRLVEQAAIALSLYWRGEEGVPKVPTLRMLPANLAKPLNPDKIIRSEDVSFAMRKRPEIKIFDLKLKEIDLKAQKARNDTLPRLDLIAALSKDVGSPVYNPDIKGPLEAGVYLQFEVPLQRRAAKGRAKVLSAQMAQVIRKKQFAVDQVVAEIRDSSSALRQTWLRISQSRKNLELAVEIEKAEREKLTEGDSDLFRVNLREQQTAAAAAALINTIVEHFVALAYYRASIGVPYRAE